MRYYEVSPVGIIRADSDRLTYSSVSPLSVGHIVSIEVGTRTKTGIVLAEVKKPPYATKAIIATIEETPLPLPLVQTALWLAEYYTTHLGVVWQTVLPRGLQKKRRRVETKSSPKTTHRNHKIVALTADQKAALKKILSPTLQTIILHGVTGSGKTQVYIEAAKQTIANGQSVIVLTPEIGLTSQLVDDFAHYFSSIILTHSQQTEAERHVAWQRALQSIEPTVVIGPRSALFMPLQNVGLIVIDESHEPSYKQELSPRYHAPRAARVLATNHNARLVLGSATPSIVDYYTAEQSGNDSIVHMLTPARAAAKATTTLVDMTNRHHFSQHYFLSNDLLAAIHETLKNKQQVLLFHNRRGSASITRCDECGWQAGCPRCFVPLTLHADTYELRCHICNFKTTVPTTCPNCHNANIIHKGIGTKRIEAELQQIVPHTPIARFDGDTAKSASIAAQYESLYDGSIPVIIGTQVVAKGLDLPHLGLVGVVQADAGLSLPDYGTSERTFQLISQAIGRVGRTDNASRAIIQTYQPTHPAITHGITQDYQGYYRHTLKERQRALFPPFRFLLQLTCIYKTESVAIKHAQKVAHELRQKLPHHVTIFGPTPAFYEKQHSTYRWQITLKSSQRSDLIDALQYVPKTNWQTELDPLSLI